MENINHVTGPIRKATQVGVLQKSDAGHNVDILEHSPDS
jgi:hypothetical protein